MVTKDSDHPWRAPFPRGCGSPCPRELGTWDGETPTHPSLQTILPSEWLAHHAEKLKEQMAPLADCLAPCGLIVRLPVQALGLPPTPRENCHLSLGVPPHLQWGCHPQGARNGPQLGLVPPPVLTPVTWLVLMECWCRLWRGGVLLFGPERHPPPNPACSLPPKSLRSVCVGLRNTVPT